MRWCNLHMDRSSLEARTQRRLALTFYWCAQKVPEPSETMRDYRALSSPSSSSISFDGLALCFLVSLSPPVCSHIECVARLEPRGG